MAKKKLNAKQCGQLLFAENRTFLKKLQLTQRSSPLAVISTATLAILRIFPSIGKIGLGGEDPQFFKAVIKEYESLLKKWYLGEDLALVKVASRLTPEEEEELTDRLSEIFGRYLKLEIEVDPQLIGGLMVKVGDKIIDRSILGKLNKLEQHVRAWKWLKKTLFFQN